MPTARLTGHLPLNLIGFATQKKAKADKKAEAALWSLLPEKERKLLEKGFTLAYGIDEAGRGPLAGQCGGGVT
jgi:hypothetical protein